MQEVSAQENLPGNRSQYQPSHIIIHVIHYTSSRSAEDVDLFFTFLIAKDFFIGQSLLLYLSLLVISLLVTKISVKHVIVL